jgi:hypothetical protein
VAVTSETPRRQRLEEATGVADAQQLTCPDCGSDGPIPIVYGRPGAMLQQAEIDGRIKLGGCIIRESNPNWFCRVCEKRWQGPEPDLESILGG